MTCVCCVLCAVVFGNFVYVKALRVDCKKIGHFLKAIKYEIVSLIQSPDRFFKHSISRFGILMTT